MKPKIRIISIFSCTVVLCCHTVRGADINLLVADGFGGSSFANAGNAQQETATAVGTIATAGDLSVTITSANVVGSPLVINVPVLAGDVANTWAGKVRTALAANPAITAQFTVGGTNAAILLTGISTPIATTDATLNIALANGTATGITAAATSANTRGATRAWTDGFAPKAGNAYFTGSNLLRTSVTATFGGDSLELSPRILESILLKGGATKTFTINDLRLNGGLVGHGDSNATYTLAGNINVKAPSGFSIGINDPPAGGANRTLNLNSAITGSNRLHIGTITGTPIYQGFVNVAGDNSAFSGGFTLGGSYNNTVATFNFNPANSTLRLNHINALGTGTTTINGGTLDLNGFSPTLTNITGAGGTVLTSVAGTAVLTIGSADATGGNFAGNVVNGTGQVAVTKIGTGSLTLSGTANTYTGDTLVSAGTLSVPANQSGAGNVTVSDGATFGANVATSGDSLVVNTLATGASSGAALILNSGITGNPFIAPISATTLTVNAPTVLRLQGTALTVASGIPLLSYGTVGGTAGLAGLSLQLPARTLGSIDTSTPGLVKANITSFEQIRWNGDVSSAWDIDPNGSGASGTLNWKTTTSSTSTRYLQGTGGTDSVNFLDSATGSTAITIDGSDVTPAGLVFNNSTKNYTFSGTKGIAGSTSLIKSGTGAVTLSTSNSFNGGITIDDGTLALTAANTISGVVHVNAGTLALNHANALGTTSLTLGTDAKLDNTSGAAVSLATVNAQVWNGDITFVGSNDLALGIGAVSIPSGSAVTTTAGTLGIGGIISGPGSGLTKKGAGTLTLSGANTYSGGTNIETGTLNANLPLENITNATSFNSLGTGPVAISVGAVLNVNSSDFKTNFTNAFSGEGIVNISSFTSGTPNGNYTGDITLSGNWSGFSGDLNLSTPTSKTNRVSGNLGSSFVSPDAAAEVSIGTGTSLLLTGIDHEFLPSIKLIGTGNAENLGALRIESVIISGPVTLMGDATVGSSTSTGVQTISGVISGAFQLGTATLGGKTITLTGNNTYSGGTLIQGCALEAGHNNALGTNSVSITSSNAASPGRLIVADTFVIANALSLSGTQAGAGRGLVEGPSSGVGTVTGPVTISATPLSGGHFGATGGTLVVQGAVTSPVPVIARAGDVTFSGGGSYTSLLVGADTVRTGAANGISTSAVLDLGTTGTATLDINGFNQQLAGLTRSSANAATVTNSGAAATLTINTTGTPTYPGDVSGSLSLTKSGSGSQNLSGSLAYSGNTTVNGGTLSLGSANTSNDASTINIATSGATLDLAFAGTDTVNQLFIGGVQQPAGVYEAVGNPGTGIEISQITGIGTLTVTTGAASNNYAAWATTNAPGQTAAQDYDNDGVKNGVEYFMGVTSPGFTASPSLSGGTVTWPKSATYSGSYLVQTSTDLATWIAATGVIDSGSSVSYTPATGSSKLFVRLQVTPN